MDKKIKLILTAVIVCIIVAGIAVTAIFGLNFDIIYSNNKQITIYIGKEFAAEDIKNIVKEVTGQDRMLIQTVELYQDMVSIKVKDITDEQLEELNTKINEKYEIENTLEDGVAVTSNANVRGRDLIKPYIIPIAVSFVLVMLYVLIYMLIKNKKSVKINIPKTLLIMAGFMVLVQALYLSIIAITRLPVNRITIPIAVVLYVLSVIVAMAELDNKYKKLKEQ